MSIKTSKRIALGIIASLVFAPLVAVAPANAATRTCTAATGGFTVQAGVSSTLATCAISADAVAGSDDISIQLATGPEAAVATFTAIGAGTLASSNTRVVAASAAVAPVTTANSGTGTINLTGSVNMPGQYTLVVGGAAAVPLTVVAATSTTSTLTATVGQSGQYVTGTSPVITVARNTAGVLADGTILGRIDTLPAGFTGYTVGEILGEGVEANMVITTDTNSRVFTFTTANWATAGSYSFTFWNDINANNALDGNEITTTASFTIAAAAAATSLISATLSRTLGTDATGLDTVTVTATVTDADGNPTTAALRVAETSSTGAAVGSLTSAASNNSQAGFTTASTAIGSSGTLLTRIGTTNTYTGNFTIDASPTTLDYVDTYLTVYIDGTIAATATTSAKKVLRIANKGGLMTTTAGTTAFELAQSAGDTAVGTVTDGVRQSLTSGVSAAAASITATVDRAHLTHTWTINGATGQEGEYLSVTITPAAATATVAATPSTVVAPATYLIQLGANLVATTSVAVTAPAAGQGYTIVITDGTNTATGTITFATPAPAWSVSPANFKAKFGDKVAVTGTLSDQFGRVQASKDVSVVVTGRNAGTVLGKTDASGNYRFEWTDASTSTVVLTDSLVFNYSYLASATSTSTSTASSSARVVTYSATGPAVASVVVSAPSATTTRPIDFGQTATGDPRDPSTVVYTATLTKADGTSVGSGVLVTFAGGADDMFVESAERVTGAEGTATITVYRQKAGASSITATSGGITSAAGRAITWSNNVMTTNDTGSTALLVDSAKAYARYITLTADPSSSTPEGIVRFVAKVTDRFGNAVGGVSVTFSETGVGRFMTGQTNPATTNAVGEVAIDLNTSKGEVGTMNVTALISDAAAVQKDDVAGFVQLISDAATAAAAAAAAGTRTAIAGVTAAVKSATATATVATPVVVTPEVVVPPVAPTLTGELAGRVLLFGSCMADEGDMIIYVKSPGKAWNEKAKTLECAAGEFDGSIKAPKNAKYYRVKQEGTGLWSSSVLIRP